MCFKVYHYLWTKWVGTLAFLFWSCVVRSGMPMKSSSWNGAIQFLTTVTITWYFYPLGMWLANNYYSEKFKTETVALFQFPKASAGYSWSKYGPGYSVSSHLDIPSSGSRCSSKKQSVQFTILIVYTVRMSFVFRLTCIYVYVLLYIKSWPAMCKNMYIC